MRNALLLALPLLICQGVQAVEADDKTALVALCKETACRNPRFKLLMPDKGTFEFDGFETPQPILHRDMLSIYPGEKLFVEASVDGERLKLERVVSSIDKPERTIELDFSQMPGKPDMQLVVKNPFKVAIRFKMGFMDPSSDKIRGTSSCPVMAGLTSYEHWPFPIFQLLLVEATALGPSAPMVCK